MSGYLLFVIGLALLFGGFVYAIATGSPVTGFIIGITGFIILIGLTVINPNEAVVTTFFGDYMGTMKQNVLRWVNPLFRRKKISLRARNLNGQKLKVNDKLGNPIEIAAVIVWRVVDTAEAVFEVDSYENYVNIQSEAALRNLATSYPYEHDKEDERLSLRSDANAIAKKLCAEVQDRLQKAGVEVLEARLSHLAYAPEIAQSMLQRQQASAVLAARKIIVQGAVGMVSDALNQLSEQGVVELDSERRAAMVSNLLVVLCGDQQAKPVINTGSIY